VEEEESTWRNMSSALTSYRAYCQFVLVNEGREPTDPPSVEDCLGYIAFFDSMARDVRIRHNLSLRKEYPIIGKWTEGSQGPV